MATKTVNNTNVYMQVAGLDIGNGGVKGTIGSNVAGESHIDIPSVASRNYAESREDEIRTPLSEVENKIEDIYNYLDATYETPCLDEPGRYFIGLHSMETNGYQMIFETGNSKNKSDQSLSFILTLGCIAGKALQDAWQVGHKLPETIDVSVEVVTLALPIQEFRRYREIYASKYKNTTHKVTIQNFEQDVVVNIVFKNVQVLAEGAAAMYAIRDGGVDLANQLIKDAQESSVQTIELTGDDIYSARAVMGVDIGEGTTNFPIYDAKGNFNADASTSINNGYGVVLDDANKKLGEKGFRFENRHVLQEYLNNPQNRTFKRLQYAAVREVVDKSIENFAKQIADVYMHTIKDFNAQILVVYVYGGGATAMKYDFFNNIVKKTRDLNGGMDAQPILYFGEDRARFLNRDGLYIAAKRILEIMQAK